MRYCELKRKEVINVLEGRSLGYICDMIIDGCNGKICSLVVPGSCGMRGLFKIKNYVIPWNAICKIGDDVILVEVDLSVCSTID